MWPLYATIVLGLVFGIMSAYIPGVVERVILSAAGIGSIGWAVYELVQAYRRKNKKDGR